MTPSPSSRDRPAHRGSGDAVADPAEARRRFRAFVRAHHPDLGGDPAVFAAEVAAYRRCGPPAVGAPDRGAGPVVFYRRRRGPARLLGGWLDRRAQRQPRRLV